MTSFAQTNSGNLTSLTGMDSAEWQMFYDYLERCGSTTLLSSMSHETLRRRMKADEIDSPRLNLLNAVLEQVDCPMRDVFPDGSFVKHGCEAEIVYRSCDDTVIKVRNALCYDEARRVWFNELFEDRTHYEKVREEPISCNGQQHVVLRQPYIEFDTRPDSWKRARMDLLCDMKSRFGDVKEPPEWPNELHLPGWRLDDLKSANIRIDVRTQRYAVVDCLIDKLEAT